MCDTTIDDQTFLWTQSDLNKIADSIMNFLDRNSGTECSPFGDKEIRKRDVKLYDMFMLSDENFRRKLAENPDHFCFMDWRACADSDMRICTHVSLDRLSVKYYVTNKDLCDGKLIFVHRFGSPQQIESYFRDSYIWDILFPGEFMFGCKFGEDI